MRIVVGVQPDEPGDDALTCAAALAGSMRADLVLAHVYPTPWRGQDQGAVDAEWRAYLVEQARSSLDRAGRRLPPAAGRELVPYPHTSTGRGLAEVADDCGAALIVIGPAAGGEPGRLHSGSTADQLLHGASVPVLLVPAGYATAARTGVPSRVTVAYQRSLDSAEALHASAQLCRRTGAPLRAVTLVVHPPRVLPNYQRALDELRADARHWLDEALLEAPLATKLSAEIAEGEDFEEAMAAVDFDGRELLVCGSGTAGPLRRVFLGDTASKILRAAPVPVLVVPRHSEPELDHTAAIPRIRH